MEVNAFRPVLTGNTVYWLGEEGLFRADASGRNWEAVGSELRHGYWGPFFGETTRDIIVATKDGIFHSGDGGTQWTKIAENPIIQAEAKREKPTRHFWLIGRNAFAWDWKNNRLFLADGQLRKLELGQAP